MLYEAKKWELFSHLPLWYFVLVLLPHRRNTICQSQRLLFKSHYFHSRNLNYSTFPTSNNVCRLFDSRIKLASYGDCRTPRLTGSSSDTGVIGGRVERDIEICAKSVTVNKMFNSDLADLACSTSTITRPCEPEVRTPLVHSIRHC